jgi:hypothetical protein
MITGSILERKKNKTSSTVFFCVIKMLLKKFKIFFIFIFALNYYFFDIFKLF